MPITKCVVKHCTSTVDNNTLFRFPRDKDCQRIWCELLTPHAGSLRSRGAAYLLNLKVCSSHFERQYLLLGGAKPRRKRIAFPTLFTAEEITSGQPAVAFVQSDVNVYTVHGYEHSETGRKRRLPANEAEETLFKKRCVVWHDHTYSDASRQVITLSTGGSNTNIY